MKEKTMSKDALDKAERQLAKAEARLAELRKRKASQDRRENRTVERRIGKRLRKSAKGGRAAFLSEAAAIYDELHPEVAEHGDDVLRLAERAYQALNPRINVAAFAELIAAHRAGATQRQLAKLAGVSQNTAVRYVQEAEKMAEESPDWFAAAEHVRTASKIAADPCELAKVLQMADAGASRSAIAAAVGRPRSTVSGWIRKAAAVPPPGPELVTAS